MAINVDLLNVGLIKIKPPKEEKKYFVVRISKVSAKTSGHSTGPLSRKQAKKIAAKTKARYGDEYHVWIVGGKQM